ncbi:MAG: epoxyqueuosine reductase [Firmicutes bacterium HGW-Firmicutes-7]|nr:MAG: epoxyqueuosine reductase [Firmicutes bacterium HGW-Firmicutes-7]
MILVSGADLCGIASVDRFDAAPEGFHPKDVLPSCQSVVVFAKKFLKGTLQSESTIPYTIVRNILSDKMDKMAVQICMDLEDKGIIAIPTGTNGPTVFDNTTGRFRNIVSAKHCAVQAGLGRIGRNTLLITPKYGNMVWLSVILVDVLLEADEVLEGNPCLEGCNLCVEICPSDAVGKPEMEQMKCWEYAFGEVDGGNFRIKCFKCREVCPYCFSGE